MKMRSVVPMRFAKCGYIVLSIALAITGVLLVAFPEEALQFIGSFFGIAMVLFGAIKLVGYFSKDLYRLAFERDLQSGILLLILGGIVLLRPRNALNFICIVLGVCLFLDALSRCAMAQEARAFGIKKWWLVFMLAVLTGLISIALIFRSYEAAKGVIVLLGVAVLTESILNLCVAILMVKIVDHQMPDVIDIKRREL